VRTKTKGAPGERGFAVVQVLIVFAIALVVAGIGFPVYASGQGR
jgi:Tfp pilus assembly major pilin PilA